MNIANNVTGPDVTTYPLAPVAPRVSPGDLARLNRIISWQPESVARWVTARIKAYRDAYPAWTVESCEASALLDHELFRLRRSGSIPEMSQRPVNRHKAIEEYIGLMASLDAIDAYFSHNHQQE